MSSGKKLMITVACMAVVVFGVLRFAEIKMEEAAKAPKSEAAAKTATSDEFTGEVMNGPISIHSGAGDHLVYVVFIGGANGVVRLNAEYKCPKLKVGDAVVIRHGNGRDEGDLYLYVRQVK